MALKLDLAAGVVVMTAETVVVDIEEVWGTALSALGLSCAVPCSD